jgi:hypothetical protein
LVFSAYPKPSSYQFFNFIATRLQEPKRRSPFSAPPGKASVMLEIPCTVGDDVWTMDEAQLFERCKADLKGLGVNIEGKTVGYFQPARFMPTQYTRWTTAATATA